VDRWIRFGLFAAWLVLGFAILIWWRRLHASRRYPYSERAVVIQEAFKQMADLALVYWSKSEKKYLRRIVTPLELDGYSLKAFDHSINDARIFKVTRIREITLVAPGSRVLPSMIASSLQNWALGVYGVAAALLLALALFRREGQKIDATALPSEPLTSPFETLPLPATNAPEPLSTPVSATPTPEPAAPAINTNYSTVPAVDPSELWEVIVDNDPSYDTNRVAQVIQEAALCKTLEAQEFARQVQVLGHASIWQGNWTQAERIRQALEAEDLLAHLKRSESP
jgi:hypothetical protein